MGVVFCLKSDRGPNGFCSLFFQTYWSIIKEDVIRSTMQFFTDGWVLPNYNSNTLILIPKVDGADYIEKYMPIAMANYNFKSKPKPIYFQFIVDRIKIKLAAWKASLLSISGEFCW